MRRAVENNLGYIHLGFANRMEYKVLKPTIDHLSHAIVKLDKDGAMYLSKGKIITIEKGTPVLAIDATGAGDIFAGTFLACRLVGHNVSQSLKEAVKIASLSVTQNGVNHLFTKN